MKSGIHGIEFCPKCLSPKVIIFPFFMMCPNCGAITKKNSLVLNIGEGGGGKGKKRKKGNARS